jgi:hypothetical protein
MPPIIEDPLGCEHVNHRYDAKYQQMAGAPRIEPVTDTHADRGESPLDGVLTAEIRKRDT